MKFTITTFTLLALSLTSTALPQGGIIQPLFTCPTSTNPTGGCCDRILPDGTGVGCQLATFNEGDQEFICNDSSSDIGQPACCHFITTPPGTHIGIPLPCVSASY